jgi:hypothetical protein
LITNHAAQRVRKHYDGDQVSGSPFAHQAAIDAEDAPLNPALGQIANSFPVSIQLGPDCGRYYALW